MKHLKIFEDYSHWMKLEKFENWYVEQSEDDGLANQIYGEVIINKNDEYGKKLIKQALEDLFTGEPIGDGLIKAALDNVKQIG